MPETYTFVHNPPKLGELTDLDFSQSWIEATPNLQRASLDKAVLFGGPLVREILETAPIVGDKPFIFVDTKVTLLMGGWYPAIPGWHTDGVPRGINKDPQAIAGPSLKAQLAEPNRNAPRYHTMIVGYPCLTEFLTEPIDLDLIHDEDEKLYSEMTRRVNQMYPTLDTIRPEVGQWATWDWWNIHRATASNGRGWRLLMRITEGITPPLETGFLRAQSQVYVPENFGW
ncbi:hypothetical protein SEA_SKOG_118 [Gordonia phage Skog]|uniref:Uncharacterized protein n=1 Tax=Gordonia phage Skog TaxID=2704033 RepID=A0A6G6XKH9_9CAUD|nr:hypothetical protein KHQ85_gp118 [Gordonia phage Skog]QIG58270.1 hypothetical protein SEA_SKOG_118 [Gordonia phage Skog]